MLRSRKSRILTITVFLFFLCINFFSFKDLFKSYFEADEWFHFTHYLPLLGEKYGAISAITKSITDTLALSEGQHIVPIGEEIFYLNTRFLELNFSYYAFISIFLHSINSFLVFLLIKELLKGRKGEINLYALGGGIFFALSAIPMHAVTWAAFYGQNVLSITFFILSILFLKKALNNKSTKYLMLSSVFFFLDLLTKETAVVLVLILPLLFFLQRGIFPLRYFIKIFSVPLIFFLIFRFLIPTMYFWINSWINSNLPLTGNTISPQVIQKGTDLSLIIFRTITFPLSMLSQVFFANATILSFMGIIAPLIYYQYPGEPAIRSTYRLFFVNGPGINLMFYLLSFVILYIVIRLIKVYFREKRNIEARTLLLGLAIIIFGALPLVLNVLRMPWWGTEYFDSRHYYMPSVGAAILFPFFIVAAGNLLTNLIKVLRVNVPVQVSVSILFILWLVNNSNVFKYNMNVIVDLTGYPRREIITQLKRELPSLPKTAVIYTETDGKGAYGTILPFQTSFPQILTVVYYPFPDSFYNKFIFDANSEGYFFSEGRGFGYYNSKESLRKALLTKKFSIEDVYGFYYDSQNIRVKNITNSIRNELRDFIEDEK